MQTDMDDLILQAVFSASLFTFIKDVIFERYSHNEMDTERQREREKDRDNSQGMEVQGSDSGNQVNHAWG